VIASIIFNKPIDQITPRERQVGKTCELGCIYGMGAEKFKATCLSMGKVEISLDLAETAVATFRSTYFRIPSFWQDMEDAARLVIQRNDRKVVSTKYKGIKWGYTNGELLCKLPSGRCLHYPNADIRMWDMPWGHGKRLSITYMTVDSKTRKWVRTSTHGRKVAENINQANARDILAAAIPRVEAANYEIVLHAHDELLTETANGSCEEFAALMAQPPDWAPDLPIKVEAWTGQRYLK